MSKRKKKLKITLRLKPVHKRAKGHPQPLSGSGLHQDRRTRRKRGGKTADRREVDEREEQTEE